MPTVHEAEVVIVGAGVSGLALALQLARAEREVLLVDRAPAPRDKVCGEGIMPLGLRCLATLGIEASALPGIDFDGIDYTAALPSSDHPPTAGVERHALRFPAGIKGRGVRRTRLLEALERAALALPGVRLIQDDVRGVEWDEHGGTRRVIALLGVSTVYRGRVFVAADGVNSRLTRWCGGGPWRYGERYGLRRHYRVPADRMPPRVQVGLFAPHDLYLTPVAPDELLATTLTDRAGFRAARDAYGGYDGFLRSTPFGALFMQADPVSACLEWYHPLFHARRYVAGGVLLVGDSGGGVDPCLGLGMSFALHTCLAAGQAICEHLRAPGLLRSKSGQVPRGGAVGHASRVGMARIQERAFESARRHLFLHTHHFGRVFRALVGSPRGARLLMWAMGRLPRMADRVLSIVADLRPWSSLLDCSTPRRSPPSTDGFGVPQGAVAPAGGETVSPVKQPL